MDHCVDFPMRSNPEIMVAQNDPSFHTPINGQIFFNSYFALDKKGFFYVRSHRHVHPVVGTTGRANQIPRNQKRQCTSGVAIRTQYVSILQGPPYARAGSHGMPLSRPPWITSSK